MGDAAKHHFRQLETKRSDIESQLGFALEWQELPDALACRIVRYRADCPLEDESRWSDYIDWMVTHIVKFDSIFRPVIKGLP